MTPVDPERVRALARSKQDLRDRMRARRRELTADWVAAGSARIAERLIGEPVFGSAGRVSLYLALPGEVATQGLIEAAWAAGKSVSVPARRPGGEGYGLARLTRETELVRGPLGVLEPARAEWIDMEDVDLMVTPGLAFDGEGRRLGHGGGHYDRMLTRLRAGGGMAIGIAFEFQVVPAVPVGPSDMPVDRVVTETRVWMRGKREH
jgi:5-formyltetrahydrofolate cyclo-ligase